MKIVIFCTVSTGLDSITHVLSRGLKVDLIVGVSPKSKVNAISGYVDISEFAQSKGINFLHVESYSLSNPIDKKALMELDIDYIWVAGWQRLLPEWLINHVSYCVIGSHGSPDGITSGRGRSPQNWALICGAEKFYLSTFIIEAGVDDGKIIGEKSFIYNEFDDIKTSYFKVSLCLAEMIIDFFSCPELRMVNAIPQSGVPAYYPQRLETDGWADWTLSQREISRICRALTKPYPGMRTVYKNNSNEIDIRIWKCQPFDDIISGRIGEISHVFHEGSFLVECRDGRIIVTDWSASSSTWKPIAANLLGGKLFAAEIKEIVQRHQQKLPDFPVSERILRCQ